MKPYYEDDWVKIYHGDAREVLPYLPKGDLLLTDPPYRQSRSGGGLIAKRSTYGTIAADLSEFDPAWLMDRLATVTKRAHGYIFCSRDLLPDYASFLRAKGWGWDILTYGKRNPLPTKNNKYLSDSEYILFYREPNACKFNNDAPYSYYFKIKMTDCITSEFGHPTEKDIGIISQLITVSTSPNDLILDLYAGSGTTLRAAKDLGRRAIGVEINEQYAEIAAKRMSQDVLWSITQPELIK